MFINLLKMVTENKLLIVLLRQKPMKPFSSVVQIQLL